MARDHITFDDLLTIAGRVGVEVVAAPSSHRGRLGTMGTVVGLTLHHTGTPNSTKSTSDYPDYEVVKEGRVGLVNSLSAFGLGRHRAIYVFSEYLSWHAGEWLYAGITDGNGHFLGIEAAGIGDWTDWQLNIYPRLVASALLFIGEGADMMPRHMDGAMPRGRKTDAANLPAKFRAQVEGYLAHPDTISVTGSIPEEIDDMTPEQAAQLAHVDALLSGPLAGALTRLDAHASTDYPFVIYQDTDPTSATRTLAVLAGPGVWWGLPNPDYISVIQYLKLAGAVVHVPIRGHFEFAQASWALAGTVANVDTDAIVAKLNAVADTLTPSELQAIATAVQDEEDARDRERLGAATTAG